MKITNGEHQQLREMIEAATIAACNDHPEYLAEPGYAPYVGKSVAKRFLGMLKTSALSSAASGAPAGNQRR